MSFGCTRQGRKPAAFAKTIDSSRAPAVPLERGQPLLSEQFSNMSCPLMCFRYFIVGCGVFRLRL